MPTVVLCIKKPSNLLRGVLRGALLEVQAGIFIGTLDAKLITHLHQIINESLCIDTVRHPQQIANRAQNKNLLFQRVRA